MAQIPENKRAEFAAAFELFDKDHSGKVCSKELGTALRSLGQNPTEAEVKELIAAADMNGDGELDLDEFSSILSRYVKDVNQEQELVEAFEMFDRNGNKFIEADELKYIMTNLGEKLTDDEVKDMIDAADVDGDGRINYKEFSKLMTSIMPL